MQHPQQVRFFPDPSLPPGQRDLEALERLKNHLINNQHEIFRSAPRLAVLASYYKGSLPHLVPPHPEQISSSPLEKLTTTPSGPSFETPSSPNFISDDHRTHVAPVVQGASLISGQGRAIVPPRPGISRDTYPSSPMDSQDQSHLLTNGRSSLQQNRDDPRHPTTSQFKGASAEHVVGDNGSGVTISLGSSPPSRPLTGSALAPPDPLRRSGTGDMQRMQPQSFSSPERRYPGSDNDRSARPSVYTSDRESLLLREMRPYDRERDGDRVHETYEQDRERERERRWSLSDHRRFDLDRRPFQNDRRVPLDSRRRPSYDRRPPHVGDDRRLPQNDDRRLPHFEDKHPPGFADRRTFDDRLPGYERRPLSEEIRTGSSASQDRPQEVLLGSERRLGPDQPMKTRVPALSSVPPSRAPAVNMAPDPVDPAADGAVTGDHRPTDKPSAQAIADNQGISASRFATPLGERSSQASSLHDRISGTYAQLGSRSELMQTGPFLGDRSVNPLETPGATPSALPGTNQLATDLSHTRVSESLHGIDLRPGFNDDQERSSLPATDSLASSTYTRALSVGRDEPRLQPPPPPRAASPSAFSSGQPSLTLRAREPSRERPPNFRPYIRSEFSRPLEDNRRPGAHSLQPSDGIRRYDERGRWSPPYGDRRSEYYDRDRPYWNSKDRTRDRPPLPPHLPPPPHWDRERMRYPEPPYAGVGLDRRFEDRDPGNRDRWYPPSYDNSPRRQFDTFAPRGRPRSPGSPSRESSELRPPPAKRVRDDAFVGSHSVTGDDYYTHPHHPPTSTVSLNKEPLPPPPPSVPTPVPIPIPRTASPLPQPPRYNHNRPPPLEPYGGTYGGYERDAGRGPTGPSYPREGPR